MIEPRVPAALAEIQLLLNGAFQRMTPTDTDRDLAARCARVVSGNDRLSPSEQVDIYREQYWLRHRSSLLEDFPALAAVLSQTATTDDTDAPFDDFARAYLAAHPPTDPSLRELPKHVVAFASTYPFVGISPELARDLIRYEFAFIDVFDGPAPQPLDASKIAAIPEQGWATARIVLNPFIARLRVNHRVHEIAYAAKSEEPLPSLERDPDGFCLVLYRRGLVVRYEVLDPAAFALLDALDRGESLVDACAALTADQTPERVAELQREIGGWFASFAREGYIDRIDYP